MGVFGQAFKDKRVVVIGAAQEIGRGITLGFAEHGAEVIAVDANAGAVESMADEARAEGLNICTEVADVSNTMCVIELFHRIGDRWGKLDVLVNNASIMSIHPILETSTADFAHILAVNTIGMFTSCREAVPLLQAAGGGSIINAASSQARQGHIYTPAYAASKMGVIGLTQSLAKELAKDRIRVNAYCPGIVVSDAWERHDLQWGKLLGKYKPGELLKEWISRIPLGEAQRPEDIANAVMFLASDAASAITGQALNIDGGMFMN